MTDPIVVHANKQPRPGERILCCAHPTDDHYWFGLSAHVRVTSSPLGVVQARFVALCSPCYHLLMGISPSGDVAINDLLSLARGLGIYQPPSQLN